MSNFEKSPTPLERLAKEAAYFDRQVADCEKQITDLEKRGDDLAADAESYRKLARETRAAIKTLEDAAKPPLLYASFGWGSAKPAFKYDFKVGQFVTHVVGDAGYIHSAYTGDNDEYLVNVCHVKHGVEVWFAKNIRKS